VKPTPTHSSSFFVAAFAAFIVSAPALAGCNRTDTAPNPEVHAEGSGKSTDVLGREIHTALKQQDATALLKLSAPPALVKCTRKSAAEFMKGWKEKHKGIFQTVGAVSDLEKLTAGATHKYAQCTAQKDVTFGQILIYSDPSENDKQAPFTPIWIVKEGHDPATNSGWYLADPL